MARVSPVQASELRPAPQHNQQQKGADPFAMLLDTVSDKRVNAPEPRRKPEAPEKSTRVEAAEKPERPQPRPEAKPTADKTDESKETCAPAKESAPKSEDAATDDADITEQDTASLGDGMETPVANVSHPDAPVVPAEIKLPVENQVETDVAAPVAPLADAAIPALEAGAETDIDATAGVQQNTEQNSAEADVAQTAPAAAAEISTNVQNNAPAVAASKSSGASPVKPVDGAAATVSAEAETEAEFEDKPVQTAKIEAPAEARKPVASNHAEVREAVIAEHGEQSSAQVKSSNTPEVSAQAKENASVKPLEHVPAQSNVENSTPRQQIVPQTTPVLPEPVRALAGSINPVNLRAANDGEGNAVQANAGALGVEIASRARDGVKRFDIRLDPPELGRVEVKLEVDANGKTSTRMIVERPETLDLLQRDARNLERALQAAGLHTEEGGLEFSLQQQGQNDFADAGSDRGYDRRGDFLASAIEDAEPASPAMDRYARSVLARGGVDIRI